jgi:hypothetical protein
MLVARKLRIPLFILGVGALAVAVWDITMGGFYFTVVGVRVSSWEAYKPFRLGMLATIVSFWLNDRTAKSTATTWYWVGRSAPAIAAAAVLASITVAVRYGIFAAGGADAYGYVSQAWLWASGRLVMPDPLAALAPALGSAVVPLGYQLGRTAGTIVPSYSPGLPMAMALALKVAGRPAASYYVVPLLGGLTVWLTYVLGARVDRPVTGMMAAILVAFSPIFMFHTLEPMSDVPATAWWMLAWVFALSPGRLGPIGSGLAVSAAVLTRPNLAPLAIVILVVVAAVRPRAGRVALFGAGALPGCVIVAVINAHLYGSPLLSGYGPVAALYEWTRWKPNLQRYTGWLIELNTPGILLAFVAPVAARPRHGVAMLGFFVGLFASYLWYTTFDTWTFLRFLLPAIPLLFILTSAVVVRGVEALPIGFRTVAVFVVCTLLPIWYVMKSNNILVFSIGQAEHRYVAVGEYVGRALPSNAVVLSMIESGSVRLYSGRLTVRWDSLEPNRLDATVETLRTSGYHPYLLLEEWELPLFREQFGAASQYGRADWPAAFQYRDINDVRIYDFADRARYLAGEPISTRQVPACNETVPTNSC